VLRIGFSSETLRTSEVISSYKTLESVERLFRNFNTELDIRPIRRRTEDRTKAHLFLSMYSYYVIFHMNGRLAPMLFQDDGGASAKMTRKSPVASALRSNGASVKAATNQTSGNGPAYSFSTLLDDLATIAVNHIQPTDEDLPSFEVVTTPTPIQRRAFELLGLSHRADYM